MKKPTKYEWSETARRYIAALEAAPKKPAEPARKPSTVKPTVK